MTYYLHRNQLVHKQACYYEDENGGLQSINVLPLAAYEGETFAVPGVNEHNEIEGFIYTATPIPGLEVAATFPDFEAAVKDSFKWRSLLSFNVYMEDLKVKFSEETGLSPERLDLAGLRTLIQCANKNHFFTQLKSDFVDTVRNRKLQGVDDFFENRKTANKKEALRAKAAPKM